MSKALVVFYSRTGSTRRVAQDIARALHAESEEIIDLADRRGALGYVRSTVDALLGRRTQLKSFSRDPSSYDLVVVGAPIWSYSLATPVRTFLEEHRGRLKSVAFFVTCGGTGSSRRVLRQMEDILGKAPTAELVLSNREISRGEYLARIRRFAEVVMPSEPGLWALHPPVH